MAGPDVKRGGCQCGAVRFAVAGPLGTASICHCRMCQKAFGNYFAPLVTVKEGSLSWTRGAPARFRSSSHVERGFCAACGTPLTYEAPDGVALAIGAFDDPASVAPTEQYGVEGRVPCVGRLSELPERHTMEDIEAAPFLADLTSYQHPDHDTTDWPEPGREPGREPKR